MLDELAIALILLSIILAMILFAGMLETCCDWIIHKNKERKITMGILYDANFAHAQSIHDVALPLEEAPVYYTRCSCCGARIYTGDDVYRLGDQIYCEDCVRSAREIAG